MTSTMSRKVLVLGKVQYARRFWNLEKYNIPTRFELGKLKARMFWD